MLGGKVQPRAHTHHPVTRDRRDESPAEIHMDFGFRHRNRFFRHAAFGHADVVSEEKRHRQRSRQIAQTHDDPVAQQHFCGNPPCQTPQRHNHHIARYQLAAAEQDADQGDGEHCRAEQSRQAAPFVRNAADHFQIGKITEADVSACQNAQNRQRGNAGLCLGTAFIEDDL